MSEGILYVVATPIGNRDDMTVRAVKVLGEVDLIAAEDTRHSRPLLRHYGIATPLMALHEHNEQAVMSRLLARLEAGERLALISDAGTPLISDPGFPLVREAIRQRIRVVPIPGVSALICALSAAGLPVDRFLFAGFPPRHSAQRRHWLAELASVQATLVFYESGHRILDSLRDIREVLGPGRRLVIGRELTKLHETFLRGGVEELLARVSRDDEQRKGEFVFLVAADESPTGPDITLKSEEIIKILADELSVKQAAALAARITGQKKNDLYQRILFIKRGKDVN